MSELSQVGPYLVHGRLPGKPIYFAQRELTREPVVLKRNNPDICEEGHPDSDSISKQVLKYEKRIMEKLDHPNICSVIDYIQSDEGHHVLVLPDNGYPLANADPVRDARAIGASIAQAADAMVYSHEKGIIHRDIKPDNLMVGDEGVTIIDWGGAYRLSSRKVRLLTLGTPGYMAPEQVDGKSPRTENDVFGLSATAFAMLTGEEPFMRYKKNDVYFNLPRPRDGLKKFGKFGKLVIAGLALNPEDRPSMPEIAEAAAKRFGLEPKFENLERRVSPIHPDTTHTTELLQTGKTAEWMFE